MAVQGRYRYVLIPYCQIVCVAKEITQTVFAIALCLGRKGVKNNGIPRIRVCVKSSAVIDKRGLTAQLSEEVTRNERIREKKALVTGLQGIG